MKSIEISEEVYEYLNSKAVGFDMNTPDKVLKVLLGINSKPKPNPNQKATQILLRWKGVDFPEGLKMRFKGKPNEVAVVEGGKILYKGKSFTSPSSAAIEANNGMSTNGWIHWEYLDNSDNWRLLDTLRSHK